MQIHNNTLTQFALPRSAGNAPTPPTPPAPQNPVDQVSHGDNQPSPVYTRSNLTPGQKGAVQMLGIGVMFGGIMASMALASPWNGVAIIGSLAGGCAIMMAAQ